MTSDRHSPARSRVPRARIDPIRDPRAALTIFGLATTRPRRDELLFMVLDHRWRGELVAVIDGNGPDSGPPVEPLLEVVDVAATAARGALGVEALGMVVATVRAGHGLRAGDADAWCAMSRRAEHHGLTLIEWFVIGPGGIHCPRDVAGEPARWPP